jgi:hypothetical protein
MREAMRAKLRREERGEVQRLRREGQARAATTILAGGGQQQQQQQDGGGAPSQRSGGMLRLPSPPSQRRQEAAEAAEAEEEEEADPRAAMAQRLRREQQAEAQEIERRRRAAAQRDSPAQQVTTPAHPHTPHPISGASLPRPGSLLVAVWCEAMIQCHVAACMTANAGLSCRTACLSARLLCLPGAGRAARPRAAPTHPARVQAAAAAGGGRRPKPRRRGRWGGGDARRGDRELCGGGAARDRAGEASGAHGSSGSLRRPRHVAASAAGGAAQR